MARLASALLALVVSTGCDYGAYFLRDTRVPMQALEGRMDESVRRECLVVLLPGMLDTPDDWVEQGFFRDARRASTRCDLVAADAHVGYYRDRILRRRVSEDILTVAEARGYREIWIVGISMGGLGSLLVTQVNPDRVRGVVLLAPYLGDEELVRSVGEDGGLREWRAPAELDLEDPDELDDALWAWLQGYATHPDSMPQLFVGIGSEDRLRPGIDLLAEVLPAERHGTVEGGHDWVTWRILWRRLLRSPPWDPGLAVPSIAD